MKSDKALREQLVKLLKGGMAYMPFEHAVKNFPKSKINTIYSNGIYSAWALLEHMRITQWDILDFIRNSKYKEREWPKGYWPKPGQKATQKDWNKTIASFKKDMKALQTIALNPRIDLYARIPHGDGQTILREILLVADHNAYHTGEFTVMRQTMSTWGKDHKI